MRYVLVAVAITAFVLVNLTFFQVETTEYAIITQFGQPVRIITDPGLYTKAPEPVQSVIRIDRRMQVYNLPQNEFLTQDKKNILVEAYTVWQVDDPLLFYESVRDSIGAGVRLADIVAAELGVALGEYDLSDLVTTNAEMMQLPIMIEQVTAQLEERASDYGFRVSDVRLKLLNFPEANRQSVFQRMRAERERIARQLRSEGVEEATKIRAEAEAQRTTILSRAQREAERIRGEGEGEAIRIYAESFGQAPEFYQFLRTLQAYETMINDGTTLILPSDSQLLKYLNQLDTAEPAEAAVPSPRAPQAGIRTDDQNESAP